MRIEKHLIGQTFIVRYMEDTDSDILGIGLLITLSLMWISNRGHVFRDGGIILPSEWRVFECVDAKEATWYSENI